MKLQMARRDLTPQRNRTPTPADFGRRGTSAGNDPSGYVSPDDIVDNDEVPQLARVFRPLDVPVAAPINWARQYEATCAAANAADSVNVQISDFIVQPETLALNYARAQFEIIGRTCGLYMHDIRVNVEFDHGRNTVRFRWEFAIGQEQLEAPGVRSVVENVFGTNNGLSNTDKLRIMANLLEGSSPAERYTLNTRIIPREAQIITEVNYEERVLYRAGRGGPVDAGAQPTSAPRERLPVNIGARDMDI